MAFTTETMPPEVALTKNPVLVTLETDLDLNEFEYKRLKITLTGNPADGDQFDFSYGGFSFTFTFATTPDDSGTELPLNSAGSLSLYATELSLELQRVFDLLDNFTISAISNEIFIDPNFGYTEDWEFHFTGPYTIAVDQQTNANYQENLKVLLVTQVFDDFNSVWGPPIAQVQEPINNRVVFDISENFDLQHDFPETNTIGSLTFNISQASDNSALFRLRYAEQYGDPVTNRQLQFTGDTFYALLGGKSYLNRYANWWATHQANGNFLSLQPLTKYISYEQPEWLYWIGKTDPTINVEIRSEVTYADGTTFSETAPTQTISYRRIYKMTTTLTQLGYTNSASNPIVSYKVWLFSLGVGTISDIMTYIIDPKSMDYERFYAFGNSYGGVEVLRGTGKIIDNPQYKWQEATVYESPGEDNSITAQFYQYDKKETQYYKGSTGYHSREYALHLKEILLADAVKIINVASQSYTSILVTTSSVKLMKDDDDLFKLEWEYRLAFDNVAHDNL